MLSRTLVIKVIADVTSDITPMTSVPYKLRESTTPDSVFGFESKTQSKVAVFQIDSISMMSVDNLPNELPRDASEAFGNMNIKHVLTEIQKKDSEMLRKATIATKKDLGPHFEYMSVYLEPN